MSESERPPVDPLETALEAWEKIGAAHQALSSPAVPPNLSWIVMTDREAFTAACEEFVRAASAT